MNYKITLLLLAITGLLFFLVNNKAQASGTYTDQSQLSYTDTTTITNSTPVAVIQTFTSGTDHLDGMWLKGYGTKEVSLQGVLCQGKITATTTFDTNIFPTPCADGHIKKEDIGWEEFDIPGSLADFYLDFNHVVNEGSEYYVIMSHNSSGATDYFAYDSDSDSYTAGAGYKVVSRSPSTSPTLLGDLYFYTRTDEEPPPTTAIELEYPVPFSSQQIIIDSPISFYELDAYGRCKTNGNDRIFVFFESYSYTPTTSDFVSQGIECIDHEWSATLTGLSEGTTDLTFWAYDFIDASSTPVYGYDYVPSQIYLYAVQSFDLDQWTTTTTSTIDLTVVPFIGEQLQSIQDSLLSKIPIGYFWQIYQLWENATTAGQTTTISIDFSFDNEFPTLSGLEWEIVDLADPFSGLSASTTAQLEDVVDFINYVLYFFAGWWFLNWVIDTYKKFINK